MYVYPGLLKIPVYEDRQRTSSGGLESEYVPNWCFDSTYMYSHVAPTSLDHREEIGYELEKT